MYFTLTAEREEELRQRFERGVALMDEAVPNWWRYINLNTFDITHCRHCVLGQVFGSWGQGKKELSDFAEDLPRSAELYGFDNDPDLVDEWVVQERDLAAEGVGLEGTARVESAFDYLGPLWVELIAARQEQSP